MILDEYLDTSLTKICPLRSLDNISRYNQGVRIGAPPAFGVAYRDIVPYRTGAVYAFEGGNWNDGIFGEIDSVSNAANYTTLYPLFAYPTFGSGASPVRYSNLPSGGTQLDPSKLVAVIIYQRVRDIISSSLYDIMPIYQVQGQIDGYLDFNNGKITNGYGFKVYALGTQSGDYNITELNREEDLNRFVVTDIQWYYGDTPRRKITDLRLFSPFVISTTYGGKLPPSGAVNALTPFKYIDGQAYYLAPFPIGVDPSITFRNVAFSGRLLSSPAVRANNTTIVNFTPYWYCTDGYICSHGVTNVTDYNAPRGVRNFYNATLYIENPTFPNEKMRLIGAFNASNRNGNLEQDYGTFRVAPNLAGWTYVGNYQAARQSEYLTFDNEDTIHQMFDDWGIHLANSTDEAINMPIEDLVPPDWSDGSTPPSGFDYNPAPVVPSNPSNKTDDFEIIQPNITTANFSSCLVFNYSNARSLMSWFTKEDFFRNLSALFENNPLSAIVALRLFPFDIVRRDTAHCTFHDTTTIVNVTNEAVPNYEILAGYNTIVFGGELSYEAYYGNFADWSATSYEVYIPFVGIQTLSPSIVVGKTLRLYYVVDLVSGDATAILKSYDPELNVFTPTNGQIALMQPCNISFEIPITYDNYAQQQLARTMAWINNGVQFGGSVVGGVVSAISGNPVGGAGQIIGGGISAGVNLTDTYLHTPLEQGAKGGMSPSCALSLPTNPYLLVHRKVQAIPASAWEKTAGKPSSYYGKISTAQNESKNFVKVTQIKLDGIPASESELSEIITLLADGVYI